MPPPLLFGKDKEVQLYWKGVSLGVGFEVSKAGATPSWNPTAMASLNSKIRM